MRTESPRWFTSSYSSNGGACVEVAVTDATVGPVVEVPTVQHDDV
ncbi:DUF397 domain-containing protein [Streptomyces sp. DH8]|nr:DUF397 domain-containing protein [Streptomyces sp. DH8]